MNKQSTHCHDVHSAAFHRTSNKTGPAEALLGCIGARSRETPARLDRGAELGIAPEEADDVFGSGDDGQLQIALETGERSVWLSRRHLADS